MALLVALGLTSERCAGAALKPQAKAAHARAVEVDPMWPPPLPNHYL